ncbi:hypothetical protein CAC42_2304 [Sphaceloma murrayae]|uniref:Uncharacterized protein n=1 Tax=Sphaceloma murrayae TaxID=2082308 RepID=A0A2K1QIU1_9PEZI|nr:hypothetical protein CAC42_2304 [Sphaceloma murrayae]
MSRSSEDKVYRAGLRYQQKHLPATRKRTRLASAQAKLTKQDSQSTLTQLDFGTPSSSFATAPEEDISDDEHVETRKPKRQKRESSSKGRQTTLTQMLSSFEEYQEGDEDVPLDPEQSVRETQIPLQVTNFPVFPTALAHTEDTGADSIDLVKESPSTGNSKANPRASPHANSTPIRHSGKRQINEIVSSVTPQSSIDTGRSIRVRSRNDRSPLKDRSTNIPSSPVAGSLPRDSDPPGCEEPESSDDDDTLAGSRPMSPIVFRKPLRPAKQPNTQAATKNIGTKRTRSFVQDSQADELGESLGDYQMVESTYIPGTEMPQRGFTQLDSSSSYLTMPNSICDPVGSALDRDAARFGQTQRSELPLAVESPKMFSEGPRTKNGEDGTLDLGPDVRVETRDYAYEINSPKKRSSETIDLTSDVPSPQPGTPTSTAVTPLRQRREVLRLTPAKAAVQSPSQPRPSQATTVDGTQSAPPSPSRIPQTYMPRSSPPPLEHVASTDPVVARSSPPYLPLPSSDSPSATPRKSRQARHSSFSPYTLASTYHRSSPPAVQEIADSQMDEEAELGMREQRKWLKRVQEVLPDSLLDYTLPVAPPWTSSPPVMEVIEDDNEDADRKYQPDGDGQDLAIDQDLVENQVEAVDGTPDRVSRKRFSQEEEIMIYGGSSSPAAIPEKDYSLVPPGSGWRSSSGKGL